MCRIRLDARGFILGPPIALALKKPFIMMRKQGKMPNSISSQEYDTEYGKRSGLTVQRDKIKKGDRVLIIDDLVATGGTLSSAINLVHMLGGTGTFMMLLSVLTIRPCQNSLDTIPYITLTINKSCGMCMCRRAQNVH